MLALSGWLMRMLQGEKDRHGGQRRRWGASMLFKTVDRAGKVGDRRPGGKRLGVVWKRWEPAFTRIALVRSRQRMYVAWRRVCRCTHKLLDRTTDAARRLETNRVDRD